MKDLKHRAIKSVFWVTLANIIGKVIATIAIFIIARQLTPADFGIYSIITTIISICLIIVSFGFDLWYVRAQNKERERYALFVKVSLLSILIISIVLFASAGLVSNFYHTEILKSMIRYLAVYFLIGGSIQLFYQYLAKHLEFRKTSIAAILRQLVQAILAVSLAFYLHNAYALFWGYIAGGIVEFIVLFIRIKKDFIRAIFDFKKVSIRNGIKTHWKFTGSTVGAQLVNVVARLTPPPILGKTFGLSAAGLYTTMDNAISTPISTIIGSVTTTSLSILSKVSKDRLAEVSLNLINMLVTLSTPIFIIIWIFTKEIILLLLGPEWGDGVFILRMLMIPIYINISAGPITQNFIILNKPHLLLYWNIVLMVGNIGILIFCSRWDLNITILGFTIFNTILRLVLQGMIGYILNIGIFKIHRIYYRLMPQVIILIIIGLILKNYLPSPLNVIVYTVIGTVLYILITRKNNKETFNYFKQLIKSVFVKD